MKFSSSKNFLLLTVSTLAILFLHTTQVQGQQNTCYSCTGDWGNTSCIDTPSGEVICPEDHWCRTERQEYKVEPDKVHRFTRGCFEEFLNYTDINAHWITYFTSCKGDKCNSGNGIRNDEDTGQTCYSCTGNSDSRDCIDTPFGEVTCRADYWCRTERQEYAEEPGNVYAFTRNCYPEFLNYTDSNAYWRHYFTSCKGDKCNSGDGVRSQTCYSCTGNSNNRRCIDTPFGDVTCREDYWCRTERQEYAEEPGNVYAFTRNCYPEFMNYTDSNAYWKHYFTSCGDDKCNSGDGIRND